MFLGWIDDIYVATQFFRIEQTGNLTNGRKGF